MKKRMSILEALKEIPDLYEGSYGGMHEDEENVEEGGCGSMYEEDSVEEGGCGSMYEEELDLKKEFLNESRSWNKFTKDLIKRERNNLKERKEKRINEHSPQREYNKRYREDWRNSTRWTR